jgi:hypothetical protein
VKVDHFYSSHSVTASTNDDDDDDDDDDDSGGQLLRDHDGPLSPLKASDELFLE